MTEALANVHGFPFPILHPGSRVRVHGGPVATVAFSAGGVVFLHGHSRPVSVAQCENELAEGNDQRDWAGELTECPRYGHSFPSPHLSTCISFPRAA